MGEAVAVDYAIHHTSLFAKRTFVCRHAVITVKVLCIEYGAHRHTAALVNRGINRSKTGYRATVILNGIHSNAGSSTRSNR